jgi:hypothetical protein
VAPKLCSGLDTAEATDHHARSRGCTVGDVLGWIVVLSDGRVTHCCFDTEGRQAIGDLTRETLAEILAPARQARLRAAFRTRDWAVLPRCAECYRGLGVPGLALDRLRGLAIRLGRTLGISAGARRWIPDALRVGTAAVCERIADRLARKGSGTSSAAEDNGAARGGPGADGSTAG